MRALLSLLPLALLATACPPPEEEPSDAGQGVDAGQEVDAGEDVDAGQEVDAGQGVDAGQRVDAGETADAGPGVDAGDEVDAGQPIDAGPLVIDADHGDCGDDAVGPDGGAPLFGDATVGRDLYRNRCARCHTVGRGPHRAPDLLGVTTTRSTAFLTDWLEDPAWVLATPGGATLDDSWGYAMPDPELDCQQIADLISFFDAQTTPLAPLAPLALTPEQASGARDLYFNRCAGCHGTYRAGGIGPNIGETRSLTLGTDALASSIHWGLPGGMPAWVRGGVLTTSDANVLAAFLQQAPPAAPAWSLADATASWQLVVAPAARPTTPQHARDWENFFLVVERDPGEVAIFDGDTHEQVARLDVGFASHIVRSSASGRFAYAVGRDGWVTMIDLWSSTPSVVARARGCLDARSVEASKYAGYEDQFLIEGCYWPPQYVVLDGATLEPLARVDVPRDTFDTAEVLPEVRVASIVASPFSPQWVLSFKETGYIALVDYSQPGFPIAARIPALRMLHDGGWDHSGRWFLVASATADGHVLAIDVADAELDASIATGNRPHPGRGANWLDPVYGWVNATVHLGEGKLAVYGADPDGRPEHAWQLVREIPLPAAGSLFLKTHDNSPYVFVDSPMAADPADARQVCAIAKATGTVERCFTPSNVGRAVHFEFNRAGDEVWVSAWNEEGELVIYDATTLEEIDRIGDLETPTGKFNVYNSAHDVY